MKTIELNNAVQAHGLCKDFKGFAKIHKISKHISWIEMKIIPEEDVSIRLNDSTNRYLHFLYNLKDSFFLQSISTINQKKLSQYQSAIMHDKRGFDTFINLKANKHYELCIVQLTKYNVAKEANNLFLHFETVFNAMNNEHYFIHTGLPNLQLGEFVKLLIETSKDNLNDRLMASGYVNILLSLKLKQYLEFVNNPVSKSILSACEIDRISKISASIKDNPELNYNIDDLCTESGMSAAKLQFGFKEMHGKTICNFVTHIRLEKAEEMLKTTDLNVTEIVYSLGWSSRSYFCKIFKQKYQCSPKYYQSLLVEAS